MEWLKRGIVYCPDGSAAWARTSAMLPTPIRISPEVIRVYVTSCDASGAGRPGYVDVAADDPTRVLRASRGPCLDLGRPGTFDENGAVACSVVAVDGRFFMYYVGFELGTKIRYRLLTGLAISTDGGDTFVKLKETPILERSPAELFFRCGPHVVRDEDRLRMWYIAGSSWTEVNGKPMPQYVVKYLESADGIQWGDEGRLCLAVSDPDEHGFGRPWVMRDGASGRYEMFYSIRRRSLGAYRLGYAVSDDGLAWRRRDAELGLDVTPGGFDSAAIMYSALIEANGRTYCLYNGDDFGRAGFGLAERVRGR